MKVRDVLAAKGAEVATVAPDATVAEVVRVLADRRIGALVVSADGQRVEGIVSERDVVAALARSGADALGIPVRDLMVTEVTVCEPGADAGSLMPVMTERRIRHIPVLEGERLVGIVSIGDVVKARVDELETDRDRLHEFIGAR